ncbi:ALKMO monooxygenase, partial [Crypturellus soui]|nr:ALKMO monooxygenase [Crypturellus soui]
EVNLLWAAHQIHHSSEDYNLFTALRQSLLQRYTSWIFNLPMALFIPPSVFAVHLQFNLLYQFWIHTEVITSLGPLEFILNTPSHHRVHHGRNPYCIDKNYGGTLIIWDRIFGTFEAEDAKVVYGLTHPVNTFEPILLQFRPLAHIWNTFWATPGFCNKLSVLFKGPGWGPGKPRLGLPEEIPVITGKEVPYNPSVPAYLNCYAVIHFAVIVDLYIDLLATVTMLSQGTVLLRIGVMILSLTSFGLLMENRQDIKHMPKAGILEFIRCSIFLCLYKLGYLRSELSFLDYSYEVRHLFLITYAEDTGNLLLKKNKQK